MRLEPYCGAMDEAVAPRVTRARTGRDIAAQLVLRSANLALGLVTTVVLVRALGDTGFGQWATVLAVLGLAGSFGLIGLIFLVSYLYARAQGPQADEEDTTDEATELFRK